MKGQSPLACQDETRRRHVRAKGFHGLDYLEVSDDQRRLTITLFGKAQAGLRAENVRLSGGRRVRDVQVTGLEVIKGRGADQDDRLVVKVDRPGDFSTYSLCLVELDEAGRPTGRPFPGFDPRYDCLDFNFKTGCASDLDCKTSQVCPPDIRPEPDINYLAKDYASFRQLLLDRLALTLPEWKERHVPDIGVTLVELLAYTGDYLSYYQDAVATEAYLDTARQRVSVRRHARLVDYPMHEGCNARAWLCLHTGADRELDPNECYFITGRGLPVEGQVISQTALAGLGPYEVFEPLQANPLAKIQLYQAHNQISFYTWGDGECCLLKGATSASLTDAWQAGSPSDAAQVGKRKNQPTRQQPPDEMPPERTLRFQAGDVLIFEEIKGPKTGNPADADPSHRHAVRLTRVTPDVDPLYDQPVLNIEWAEEDALPFPLCLSTVGNPPECASLADVSVARGNVILVDHGRRITGEDLGCVPAVRVEEECATPCRPPEIRVLAGWYRPTLKETQLIFSQPLPQAASAAVLLRQDPRRALPWIRLSSVPDPICAPGPLSPLAAAAVEAPSQETIWAARYDLLSSQGSDAHFVVETDDERRARLRFGDGDLGSQPTAWSRFTSTYRVGQGLAGNVGAETITHIVFKNPVSGADLRPRNPLPAYGGVAPEPTAQVKLFAPQAFQRELARAIVAEDYAEIVRRDFAGLVQRAAAALRWNGRGYEVLVAVDPTGSDTAAPALLEAVSAHLYAYRRIGHDLSVQPARCVPLDIRMTVDVRPEFLRGHVAAALLDAFSNRQLPDGRLGFFHPDNLTFGEGVFLSKLMAAAAGLPGVEHVKVNTLERLFAGSNGEIESGVLPLGPLEVARLDNDPGDPDNGRISFCMRGGR